MESLGGSCRHALSRHLARPIAGPSPHRSKHRLLSRHPIETKFRLSAPKPLTFSGKPQLGRRASTSIDTGEPGSIPSALTGASHTHPGAPLK